MVVTKERDIGLDIIRSVAILCVVCGHFFSVNTPFNDVPLVGISMIFQGFLKSIFCNLGVPFFLMLSGYLCCKKEFSLVLQGAKTYSCSIFGNLAHNMGCFIV